MPSLTIRNVPDEVHRAIKVMAARHGNSVEAEMRDILETVARPPQRVKLGTLLFEAGRKINLTAEEFALFESMRDHEPARAASFE